MMVHNEQLHVSQLDWALFLLGLALCLSSSASVFLVFMLLYIYFKFYIYFFLYFAFSKPSLIGLVLDLIDTVCWVI